MSASQPIPTPPRSELEAGGNLLLQRFGGGDTLYGGGYAPEQWIEDNGSAEILVCHHSAQTRKDYHAQLKVEAIFAFCLYGLIALLIFAALIGNSRQAYELKEAAKFLLPCIALGAAIYTVYKYIAENPNYGWERKKWIDVGQRQFHVRFESFGKEPESKSLGMPLDELVLIAWENNHWEGAPSFDISLIKKEEIDEIRKSGRGPAVLCNLYMGDSMRDAMQVGMHMQKRLRMRLAQLKWGIYGKPELEWISSE